MSTTYNGQRAIFSSVTTGSSTYTSTITTVGSHGLSPGDHVHIVDAAEVQLNGVQTVVTTPTGSTFTVHNTLFGAGSGGAQGFLTIGVDGESITIPSDGDGPGIKVADVNTPFEGLQDAVADLEVTASSYQLVNVVVTPIGSFSEALSGSEAQIAILAEITGAQIGDFVETVVQSSVELDATGASIGEAVLELKEYVAAALVTPPAGAQAVAVINVGDTSNFVFPFSISSFTLLQKAGTYQSYLFGALTVTSGSVVATAAPTLLAIQKLWRPL